MLYFITIQPANRIRQGGYLLGWSDVCVGFCGEWEANERTHLMTQLCINCKPTAHRALSITLSSMAVTLIIDEVKHPIAAH